MSELFDEVDEEVRRDQLKKLWDQYSIYIIAGALLIIAAVGGWRGYQYLEAKKAAEAGAAFDKAVELSEQNKHAEAEAAFTDLAAKAPSGYRMLARLRAAAEAASPRSARRRRNCMTTSPPIAASARESRISPGSARPACCWTPRAIPTCLQRLEACHRARGDLSPYRARIAGAVGLARQRHGGGAEMAGHDCQRWRDAAEPALARRGAAGFAAAGREELTAGNELSEKSTMRRSQRLIAAAVLIALSGALAGCSSGLTNFDPSDLLDFLDTKKKLPGERKPVFPEGVPGLEQGVPKELYKGSAQEQQDQQNAAAAAAAAAPRLPRSRSRSTREIQGQGQAAGHGQHRACAEPAGRRADRRCAAEEEGSTAAAPPAPKPKKIVRKRTTAPPPDQPAAQPAQPAPSAQPPQQSPAPFPAPLPSGSFTR